ncbi:MAG: hypothetical protein E7631_12095 [Ruminococcaceae bacterium]|nr:hypothetical protein [Oscillospiraceae bacterium]
MYQRFRRNMLQDALSEMQYEKLADSGQQYFMFLPRKYLFNRGIRLFLVFLLCILACYKYFALPTPPLFLIAFRKFNGYCQYLQSMNVSVKKLRILLGIWIVICICLHVVFWAWIRQIL